MLSDLRLALRLIVKSPGFTAVIVLTLALGIGGNTAIFSVLNTLLLEPLPYRDSRQLVLVGDQPPNSPFFGGSTGGVFLEWEDRTTQLESIAAFHNMEKNLTGAGEPVRIAGADVSAKYLHVLGINPILGRDFLSAEDAPGGNRNVVILSYECWQRRFQGDTGIVGRAVTLDSQNYTVIGILPPQALLLPTLEFLTPATIRADEWKQSRDYNYPCAVIARLKPGANMDQVAAELNAAKRANVSLYPAYRQPWIVVVRSLQEGTFGNTRPAVLTLLTAVGAVLLIACANVANLLLARAASRQGEFAVRSALGASRGRIVGQLLTESMVLALLGGAAGLLLGAWAIKPLVVFTGLDAFQGLAIGIDVRVFMFALGATCFTGLLFGLFPALGAARSSLGETLKDGGRGSASGTRRKLQSVLIVAETALTVVLLACAGLLLRSFVRALNADTGFDRERVIVFTLSQSSNKAPTNEHRIRFVRDVLRSVAQIPGVAHAGMASSTPMNGQRGYGDYVSREDKPETRNDLNSSFDSVDGEFFQAFGIPLLRGRYFTEADNGDKAAKVMIVNDVLARRLFGAEDPIGRMLHFKDAVWQIVGVVGSVRQYSLDIDPQPQLYFPQAHFPWYTMIAVRMHMVPLTVADDIRRAVHAVDAEVPIAGLTTLEQAVNATLRTRRVVLTLVGLFAGIALLLACIGIYGVMAYSVAQRTREIGIRIALGAGARRVIALVMGDGFKLVGLGLAIGAAASYGAARAIGTQLYATSQTDPLVLVVVSAILVAVAGVACWVPARRATRVNPVEALRAE